MDHLYSFKVSIEEELLYLKTVKVTLFQVASLEEGTSVLSIRCFVLSGVLTSLSADTLGFKPQYQHA